jgi:hypothetical protein
MIEVMISAIEQARAWKIHLFLSFQIVHQMSWVSEIQPLRLGLGIMLMVSDNQSRSG